MRSRIAIVFVLPSSNATDSASALLNFSGLNHTLHKISVYASTRTSPDGLQDSIPTGPLRPLSGRTFICKLLPALPGAQHRLFRRAVTRPGDEPKHAPHRKAGKLQVIIEHAFDDLPLSRRLSERAFSVEQWKNSGYFCRPFAVDTTTKGQKRPFVHAATNVLCGKHVEKMLEIIGRTHKLPLSLNILQPTVAPSPQSSCVLEQCSR